MLFLFCISGELVIVNTWTSNKVKEALSQFVVWMKWLIAFNQYSQLYFLEWKSLYCDANLLKFNPKGLIVTEQAMVEVMVWCQAGNKPLSKPVFNDIYGAYGITRPELV